MEHQKLPKYLLNSWHLQQFDERQAKKRNELDGWTVSSLSEAFLQYQLNNYKVHQETQGLDKSITPSLSSMIASKIFEELNGSRDLNADVQTIAAGLNSNTLRQLMRDSRIPYPVLRAFDALPQQSIARGDTDIVGRAVDIDEAVLRNERYIRCRGGNNNDGKYLVGMKELVAILAPESKNQSEPLVFTRKDPPKGGLEVLDERRQRVLRIQPNDDAYTKTFERITNGALRGLDWTNVLVAGGMALTTLTHVDASKDGESTVSDCDIDVYLYGLSPEQANRKVEEIYNVWNSNLRPGNRQRIVVKNAKTINLLADYPQRRIQIVLKLLPSPTAILLNFDLDPCAIGFNGSQVFMLPRCARALETGYSVFTMDLIWGHHLGDRRATQETRVFKYADRGFGLRILPSYAQSLEDDNLKRQCMTDVDDVIEKEDVEQNPLQPRTPERDRKPFGSKEPGLKTLKRVAYLGQDFVHRFYFGTTPLAIFPNRPSRRNEADLMDIEYSDDEDYWTTSRAYWENEDDWKAEFARIEQRNFTYRLERKLRQQAGERLQVPNIYLEHLDTREMHYGLTDSRQGLGNFELFMRHSEAWRLDACCEARLERQETTNANYDSLTYNDLPTYLWYSGFNAAQFAKEIELSNDELFESLKTAIVAKLGPPPTGHVDGGYRNYLTRRIRRQVYGPDLASVMEKQITIPLLLPLDLENHILNSIPARYADLPEHATTSKSIIPVHDASKYDVQRNSRRSLQDTFDESGNLRYWVITNESMWAGQHRALDEIAELLWTLFHWFNRAVEPRVRSSWINTNIEPCIWHVARAFRRRIILPGVPSDKLSENRNSVASAAMKPGLSSLRESMLFRPWVFQTPPCAYEQRVRDGNDGPHDLFDEKAILYPFPDELFWEQGDEGLWNAAGVPPWREPAA